MARGRFWAFGFGNFAYLTDCNRDPGRVIPAARRSRRARPRRAASPAAPHAFHGGGSRATSSNVSSPGRTFFTHICHDLPHAATNAALPAAVELAYDGLTFDISRGGGEPIRSAYREPTRPGLQLASVPTTPEAADMITASGGRLVSRRWTCAEVASAGAGARKF